MSGCLHVISRGAGGARTTRCRRPYVGTDHVLLRREAEEVNGGSERRCGIADAVRRQRGRGHRAAMVRRRRQRWRGGGWVVVVRWAAERKQAREDGRAGRCSSGGKQARAGKAGCTGSGRRLLRYSLAGWTESSDTNWAATPPAAGGLTALE